MSKLGGILREMYSFLGSWIAPHLSGFAASKCTCSAALFIYLFSIFSLLDDLAVHDDLYWKFDTDQPSREFETLGLP